MDYLNVENYFSIFMMKNKKEGKFEISRYDNN